MSDKKTVIITGSNSGLGFECARIIAQNKDYRVILACRNIDKAEQAKAELIQKSGDFNIDTMELDVSSLASVQAFVTQYKNRSIPLYGLICNAGINGMTTGQTVDGFDSVFATNHLGHFLLTNLLIPVMLPTGRIAVVSSDMHCPPGMELVWPTAQVLAYPNEQLSGSTLRYSYSKLCNLYFTYELSRRLISAGSAITVNGLNPGLMIDTGFAPDKSRFTPEFLDKISSRMGSLQESSKALADMIIDPSLATITGKYFDRSTSYINSSPLSYNQENALELWNASVTFSNSRSSI